MRVRACGLLEGRHGIRRRRRGRGQSVDATRRAAHGQPLGARYLESGGRQPASRFRSSHALGRLFLQLERRQRVRAGTGHRGSLAAERRHLERRPDLHLSPAPRRDVARRGALRRTRRDLHLARDHEQEEQHSEHRRLRSDHGDRHARSVYSARASQRGVGAVRRDLFQPIRHAVSRAARAPLGQVSQHQPGSVQRQAGRHGAVQRRALAARFENRLRGQSALLARRAQAQAHRVRSDSQREHDLDPAPIARDRPRIQRCREQLGAIEERPRNARRADRLQPVRSTRAQRDVAAARRRARAQGAHLRARPQEHDPAHLARGQRSPRTRSTMRTIRPRPSNCSTRRAGSPAPTACA